MKFRRQRRRDDGINLTPLIDVVFLLLIFFMVSTTFTRETRLAIELPEAGGERADENSPARIEVIVDSSGGYAINGRVLINRQIDTVMAALKEVSQTDSSTPVTISADEKAPHGAVITVMDAAGRLGFQHLTFATQEPGQSSE